MDETYTAEQLRRDAIAIERMHGETLTVEWRGHQASQLRAHADALEENARLRAELGKFSDRNGYALRQRAERAEAELAKLRHAVDLAARAMHGEGVDDQAQAWDVCLRILDAARADFTEGK